MAPEFPTSSFPRKRESIDLFDGRKMDPRLRGDDERFGNPR
jgi:hypothetical protein